MQFRDEDDGMAAVAEVGADTVVAEARGGHGGR